MSDETAIPFKVLQVENDHSANVSLIELSEYVQKLKVEHQVQLQELQQHVKQLQRRNGEVRNGEKESSIAEHFASNVDSIVGLKEALTWQRGAFKFVWATLLVLGLAATLYYIVDNAMKYLKYETATKVTLDWNSSYDYPPLVVCPPFWFDVEETRTSGLSDNALKYSLGYSLLDTYNFNAAQEYTFSKFSTPTSGYLKDIDKAKTEFMAYYEKNNFGSLVDYFNSISANMSSSWDPENPATIHNNCAHCLEGTMGSRFRYDKILFDTLFCYAVELKPAEATFDDIYSSLSGMILKSTDKTNGLLDNNMKDWHVDFLPNVSPNGPVLTLKPNYNYNLRLRGQRIVTLPGSPSCVDNLERPKWECLSICLSKNFDKDDFRRNSLATGAKPNETVNIFSLSLENAKRANTTLEDTDQAEEQRQSKENTDKCYKKCLPACDRIVYELTYERGDEPLISEINISTTSEIGLNIQHAAVSQGGVMTLEEQPPQSFGEFVSNVGGTLGLFLGCTLMTLAQFILVLINYALDNKTKKSTPSNQNDN